MRKCGRHLLFGGLLLLAAFLRIYHIASVPLEMHIDEAGLGLNAWSMAHFCTDRYGNFMPVCPVNFYGEQSAFYTCFCALLVKLFGLNLYTLRMPGVVMGLLTVVFGSLLIREELGEKGLYAGLALLGIFPYFIMNCRFALDCNAMLGALTVAVYGLVRIIRKAERSPGKGMYLSFAFVGILFGIVLYTYIIAAVAVAVFCILFGAYYLFCGKGQRTRRLRQLFFMALPLGLMAVPLIMVVYVNFSGAEAIVTPFFTIPKMAVNRTREVLLPISDLSGKLRGLLHTLTTDGQYGSSGRYWTMYPWSVPMTAAGFLFAVQGARRSFGERRFGTDHAMLFLTAGELVLFLLCGRYNYHVNGIFIALAYFCVRGMFGMGQWLGSKALRRAYIFGLAGLYGISFLSFSMEYYGAGGASGQVFGGVREALSLLTEEQRQGEIYVLDEVGEFWFLSDPIPPRDFLASCDELGYVRDYENMHFHEPEEYGERDIFVCSKASGRHHGLSDEELTGHVYVFLETEHYYVFYGKGE